MEETDEANEVEHMVVVTTDEAVVMTSDFSASQDTGEEVRWQ